MKKLALLALSFAAAGAAFAEDPTIDNSTAVFNKTRDQVNAELVQARTDGSVKNWSTSYNPFAKFDGQKTREEVRAEVLANRDTAAALYGEDSGSFALSRTPASRQAAPLYAGTPKRAQ